MSLVSQEPLEHQPQTQLWEKDNYQTLKSGRVISEPIPRAAYNRNVKWGPRIVSQSTLQEGMPNWAPFGPKLVKWSVIVIKPGKSSRRLVEWILEMKITLMANSIVFRTGIKKEDIKRENGKQPNNKNNNITILKQKILTSLKVQNPNSHSNVVNEPKMTVYRQK